MGSPYRRRGVPARGRRALAGDEPAGYHGRDRPWRGAGARCLEVHGFVFARGRGVDHPLRETAMPHQLLKSRRAWAAACLLLLVLWLVSSAVARVTAWGAVWEREEYRFTFRDRAGRPVQ